MNINYEEIIKKLKEPFNCGDVEWKIQVTSQDKNRGMAVAYLDARAVQKCLDEVVGPFNWKNVYSLWHDHSQICGISIFNAERSEWVTKWDGAENSEIEPIKGGLSDSFKRAASVWGIGRYLYQINGIWVDVEAKGKSFAIKQDQLAKLEAEYNAVVSRIFETAPKQQDVPADPPGNQTPAPPSPEDTADEFKVHSVKPSGQSSQVLELIDSDGNIVKAYIKTSDQSITVGARLRGVQMERKNSHYGEYNLISGYQLAA